MWVCGILEKMLKEVWRKKKKTLSTWGFLGVKKCGDIVLHFHACFLKSFFSIGFYIGSVLCS